MVGRGKITDMVWEQNASLLPPNGERGGQRREHHAIIRYLSVQRVQRECNRLLPSLYRRGIYVFLALVLCCAMTLADHTAATTVTAAEQVIDVRGMTGLNPQQVLFSPDGRWLAVAADRGVLLYNAISLDAVWLYPSDYVRTLAFSPDSGTLAALLRDRSVHLLRVSDGTPTAKLNNIGPSDYSRPTLVFGPCGILLAAGSDSGYIRVWHVADGRVLHDLRGGDVGSVGIAALNFSRDGETLVTMTGANVAVTPVSPLRTLEIRVWRLTDGVLLRTVIPNHVINPVGLAREGTVLYGLSTPSGGFTELRRWRVTDTALVDEQLVDGRRLDYALRGGTFSYDETLFVIYIGASPGVAIYSTDDSTSAPRFADMARDAYLRVLSPDNQTIASPERDGKVYLWLLQSP